MNGCRITLKGIINIFIFLQFTSAFQSRPICKITKKTLNSSTFNNEHVLKMANFNIFCISDVCSSLVFVYFSHRGNHATTHIH